MKRHLGFGSLLAGGTLLALAAQPVQAATVITGIQVNPTGSGVELVLQTESGTVPQFFSVNQGNTLRADLTNTQLRLANGSSFAQQNPGPGVDLVTVVPLDANSVRLTINGATAAPVGQITSTDNNRVVIGIETTAVAQAPSAVPATIQTVPGTAPNTQIAQAAPAQQPVAQQPATPQTEATPDVMVPNPEVTIDGVVVPQPTLQTAPPFLPRAVAPPVGDIAIATLDNTPAQIDLGTAERVPRLVLRNAPAAEVLQLLARTAGLNLAYNGSADAGPTITLDIENESVQDVFNHVVRLSGLSASRVGRTIYVGTELPDAARNVVSRTLRMNQVSADGGVAFLASLGAEGTQTVTTEETQQTTTAGAVEGAPDIATTSTRSRTTVEGITYSSENAVPVLRGLQAVADSRLNAITLVGEPYLVELASRYLVQLDLRKRQVAVNVRIVDVNLTNSDIFGTSLSFSTGNLSTVSNGGAGIINLGPQAPLQTTTRPLVGTGATPGVLGITAGPAVAFVNQLLGQISAQITNGNAKILTDPTLVIQEGQSASVNLTQDVITNVTTTISASTPPVTTTTTERDDAGLILGVQVKRIDDNGFITLNISPSVTAIASSQQFQGTTINLLARREVSSGDIRMRDGQTLIVAGIIQDQERVNTSKIPILGDLPLIGALFRSTQREDLRAEVVVLVTPHILDDSDQAVYGYSYVPSEDVQELIQQSQQR